MDTSEQYIKMCAAAATHLKNCHSELINGDFYVYHMPPMRSFDVKIFHEGVTYQNDIWLPRLDQLHAITGQKWDNFFQNCIEWKTDLDEIGALQISRSTAEQVALTSIMYENSGMIWTGSAWEKGEYYSMIWTGEKLKRGEY